MTSWSNLLYTAFMHTAPDMSTTVFSLLAMVVTACVTNLTPAVAQCTTTDCFDNVNDVGVLAAMVYRLQATVERQQNDCHYSLKQLQHSVEEQQKQLTKLKECMYCHVTIATNNSNIATVAARWPTTLHFTMATNERLWQILNLPSPT